MEIRKLTELSTIYQRLSTGKRINSAADDAAGMAISEKIGALARGIDKGTDNARDMQNLLRTAEGGLNSINDSLQRIREIGVQAMNGIYTDSDRALMQAEVSQMLDHVKTAAQNTEFNTMKLLDGTFKDKIIQTGANKTQDMTITIGKVSAEGLLVDALDISGPNTIPAAAAIETIDDALQMVSDFRADLGAYQNRLEYKIQNLDNAAENMAAAESRIRDADMAKMMTEFTKNNIMFQASTAMLAQANALPQSVLQLLG